jgi:hypothetical protein
MKLAENTYTQQELDKAEAMLSYARLNMMIDRTYPTLKFYSLFLQALPFEFASIGTMGTDGKKIYVDPYFVIGLPEEKIEQFKDNINSNPDLSDEDKTKMLNNMSGWFNAKTTEELMFVFVHEVRHIIGDTASRGNVIKSAYPDMKPEDIHKLVNIAADYQINNAACYEFTNLDFIKMIDKFPVFKNLYYKDKYCSVDKDDQTGKNMYQEWTMEEIFLDMMQDPDKYLGDGDGKGMDVHMEIGEKELREAMGRLASVSGRLKGEEIPEDVRKIIDELVRPKVCWKKHLRRTLAGLVKNDYTYEIPHYTSWTTSEVLRQMGLIDDDVLVINPSTVVDDRVEMNILFDSSGSIYFSQDDVKMIMSEIAGIVSSNKNTKIHMACFDTRIHNYQVFEDASLKDIAEYEVVGGGGSDLRCFGGFMKDAKLPKDNIVVFTDMYIDIDWSHFKNFKNVIFVVYNNKDAKIEVGTKIVYEDAN